MLCVLQFLARCATITPRNEEEKLNFACDYLEGAQANAMVIKYLLSAYQGVIAPATGHISLHESSGHKVLCAPEYNGKLTAADVEKLLTVLDEI